MLTHILLASRDHQRAQKIRAMLESPEVVIRRVEVGVGQWQTLASEAGDIVILERSLLQEPLSQTIETLSGLPESPFIVVLTESEDPDDAALLTAVGCTAVLSMGASDAILRHALMSLVERKRGSLDQQVIEEPGSEPDLGDFVSLSSTMQTFMATVQRVAGSNASLLITGETGVGKEHLARAIHRQSSRSEGPFVAVNCGAIPESLMESELFGHEKGAFTGATRNHKGWFECAHGGTLFLDEIGELPTHLQVRLLRVLQFREVRRVGSEREIKIDVRIMAATNRDPQKDVDAGSFRADLYYRLSVIQLPIPSLRERRDDIPFLAERLLKKIEGELGRRGLRFTAGAVQAMSAYDWPGNVRELHNVIERAVLLSPHETIGVDAFPLSISAAAVLPGGDLGISASQEDGEERIPTLPEARARIVAEFEEKYLRNLLEECDGRIGECAEKAGITARSLYQKMQTYGLRKEDFKLKKP